MTEETFPILPARRRQMALWVLAVAALAVLSVWQASGSGGQWGWGLLGLVLAALAGVMLVGLLRRRYVARLDATGVSVTIYNGRVLHAGWSEIQAHMIDPTKRLGGVIRGDKRSGAVRILPVSTWLMGPEAAERMVAAMKARLPKLEYRMPGLGAAKK